MNVSEAARALGIGEATVVNLQRKKKLPLGDIPEEAITKRKEYLARLREHQREDYVYRDMLIEAYEFIRDMPCECGGAGECQPCRAHRFLEARRIRKWRKRHAR